MFHLRLSQAGLRLLRVVLLPHGRNHQRAQFYVHRIHCVIVGYDYVDKFLQAAPVVENVPENWLLNAQIT